MDELHKGSFHFEKCGLLSKSTSLEELSIGDSCDLVLSHIDEFLQNLKFLKNLSVHNTSFLNEYTANRYQFSLLCFSFTAHTAVPMYLQFFLNDHQKSIEKLQYGPVLSYHELRTLLSFPNLSELKLLRISFEAKEHQNYPVNCSISSIEIEGHYKNADDLNVVINNLLYVLKHLKFLTLSHFDGNILESVFTSKSLRKIEYSSIHNVSTHQKIRMMMSRRILFLCNQF